MGCGCGPCEEKAARPSDLELAANPNARKLGQSSAMIGDILPTIIFPADVKAYKLKIDPAFKATEAAVSRCANLPAAEAVAWGDFYTDWRKLADGGVAFFASWEAQLIEVKRFESELADWQDLLEPTCPLPAPAIHPPGTPFPTATVLLVAGAVVVVGAVGYSFYRTAQQAGARAKKGREFLERRIDAQLESGGGAALGSSTALARR